MIGRGEDRKEKSRRKFSHSPKKREGVQKRGGPFFDVISTFISRGIELPTVRIYHTERTPRPPTPFR